MEVEVEEKEGEDKEVVEVEEEEEEEEEEAEEEEEEEALSSLASREFSGRRQGLELVHFSAQLKHCLGDTLVGTFSICMCGSQLVTNWTHNRLTDQNDSS